MKIIEKLKKFFVIPQQNRKEFNERRAGFNQNTLFYTCLALVPGLLIVYLIGFFGRRSEGTPETLATVILYFLAILVCVTVCMLLFLARCLKNKGKHIPVIITDIICSIAYTSFILLFLFSYNSQVSVDTEAGVSSPIRIDVFIILLFTIVFITRFPCWYTLSLQTLYTVILIVWLVLIRGKINNFTPSVVNLTVAFFLAVISTCSLWITAKRDFFNAKNMESLISSDFLTRLKNRRGFDVFLAETWKSATENDKCLTMFMIDIDNFKLYNDTLGHVEGDTCLRAVAKIIAGSLRRDDFAARYGGEEFAVLMSGGCIDLARSVAQRILDKLKETNMPHPQSVEPYVTVSIGVAMAWPARGEVDPIEFVRNADSALYTAKKTGKNKIVFFEE